MALGPFGAYQYFKDQIQAAKTDPPPSQPAAHRTLWLLNLYCVLLAAGTVGMSFAYPSLAVYLVPAAVMLLAGVAITAWRAK